MPIQLQDEICSQNENSFHLNQSELHLHTDNGHNYESNNEFAIIDNKCLNSNVKTHDLIDYFNSKVSNSKLCNESSFYEKNINENNSIQIVNNSKLKNFLINKISLFNK